MGIPGMGRRLIIGPSVLHAPAEQPIGPSVLRAPAEQLRWPLFLSERSACAALGCWHKRRWPLFLVINPFLVVLLHATVVKIP